MIIDAEEYEAAEKLQTLLAAEKARTR